MSEGISQDVEAGANHVEDPVQPAQDQSRGLSRRKSIENLKKRDGLRKPLPAVKFHIARGLSRSEAKRKCLQMIRRKEPGQRFAVFNYDRDTGVALAVRI